MRETYWQVALALAFPIFILGLMTVGILYGFSLAALSLALATLRSPGDRAAA